MKWGEFFDGKDKPIRAMEHADLINILHYDGMLIKYLIQKKKKINFMI